MTKVNGKSNVVKNSNNVQIEKKWNNVKMYNFKFDKYYDFIINITKEDREYLIKRLVENCMKSHCMDGKFFYYHEQITVNDKIEDLRFSLTTDYLPASFIKDIFEEISKRYVSNKQIHTNWGIYHSRNDMHLVVSIYEKQAMPY